MDSYKRMNWLLRVVQFAYLASVASFINYLVLYLNHIGYSDMHIGVIHGVGAGAMLLIQPVLGRILDRTQNFRKVLLVVLLLCMGAIALVPVVTSWIWLELFLIVLLYAVIKQFSNVIDVWTYQLRKENPQVAYGSTRGIGSIGEGLSAFVTGYLIAWFGFNVIFILTIGLLAITMAAGLALPNPQRLPEEEQKKKAKLTVSRQLVLYIASFLFLKISVTLISTFCSLMVQRLGGGSEWYGFIVFLCGIAELPAFICITRWCREGRVKLWYRLCIALGLTGSLLASLAPNLPIFIIGRIMLTLTYAAYTVVNLEYVKTYVAYSNQAQVMLLIGAFSGSVSYMASSLLGGYLMELGSQTIMAAAVAALFALSWLLHGAAFRKEPQSGKEEVV